MSSINEPDESSYLIYDPVTIFRPLSRATGINLDQINFVMCLLAAFPIGFWYRIGLAKASRTSRSAISAVVGLFLCYICYGNAIIHLFLNSYGSYLLITLINPRSVHRAVFFFSMSYLILIHAYRWLYQKTYCLDVTGSMMVAVGKVTLLATGVHDGMGRNRKELTAAQEKDAIRQIPSLLDFTSYMFNFQTVIIGPMNHFSTWSSFLDCQHVPIDRRSGKPFDPTATALKKFQVAIGFSVVYAILSPSLPMTVASDPEYNKLHLIHWWFWHALASMVHRFPYYFAWIITDSICNISGFGFDGFDSQTMSGKWSKTTNVHPMSVELGQNYKEMVDNWNIWTVAWLRRVVYERVDGGYRTIAVYVTGAAWHGLAVGYYFSFLTSALFTLAAQQFRRCVRHYFVKNTNLKIGYDIFGIIVSKFVIGYIHYPFFVMHFWPSIFIYRKLFLIPHLIAALIYFCLPTILPPQQKSIGSSSVNESFQTKKSLSEKIDKSESTTSPRTSTSQATAKDFEHQLTMRRDV